MTPRRRSSPRAPGPVLEERAFHAWLTRRLPWGSTGTLPLGDDAAALEGPPGHSVVVSTDALVDSTHFLASTPPERVGRTAVAVGLSDVASKGARPAAALVALVTPRGTPERWARDVVLGAEFEAARFHAHVVGGDTKPGATPTVVGTVLGWASSRALVSRSGATAGDLVVTTGVVGAGGAASRGLEAGGSSRAAAVRRMMFVEPRVHEALALAPFATAMLDTSDGIADAARLLAAASRVRVELVEDDLPWHPSLASLRAGRRRTLGFYGGDYEMLATIRPNALADAQRAVEALGTPLSVVGAVTPGRGAALRGGDRTRPMPPAGWRPFR